MRKYSVGIDLGTTNCVVAFAELDAESPAIALLPIEQVTAPNQVESLPSLASFLYLQTEQEQHLAALAVPGRDPSTPVVGEFARRISAEQPERSIAAAKSWLCHGKVDRHAPLLPWGAPEDLPKLSPVGASQLILQQLVASWQQSFPDHPLREQLVTLTVPASFDMAARELTREAALKAGLPDEFILLEEPQAAVYHWLEKTGDRWRHAMREGDTLLVCDVGGGTTDLTLLRTEQEAGELVLRRLAVGDHLLVGGDNMDLALAHFAASKFREKGLKLNAWQSVSLWHACRKAKESLLAPSGKERETISVLGRGSKLIAGTVSIEVDRQVIQQLLVDGFFPPCAKDSVPQREPSSGFQEIGLPFESDTAITRHIAHFVNSNAEGGSAPGSRLHLLLNGGVFKATSLRDRLHQVLSTWSDEGKAPAALGGPEDLDHAVARGAAYYGWTKQHGGMRIRGGTARSYYVGIESSGLAIPGMPRPLQAVCVVPFGMEEGSESDVPGREVGLVVGREVQFRFFASATRKEDRVGTVLRDWDEEELVETAPMHLTLPADDAPDEGFVPVRFHSKINELGVFELWCNSVRNDQCWKLEFNVREDAGAVQA
jgi:Hsp70 protein